MLRFLRSAFERLAASLEAASFAAGCQGPVLLGQRAGLGIERLEPLLRRALVDCGVNTTFRFAACVKTLFLSLSRAVSLLIALLSGLLAPSLGALLGPRALTLRLRVALL